MGGGSYDPNDYAQNDAILLGKMLRIDVRTQPAGQPYGIPNDNPNFGNLLCNGNGTGGTDVNGYRDQQDDHIT